MTEEETRALEIAVHECLHGPANGKDLLSGELLWDLQEAPRYALASSGEAMRIIEDGLPNQWRVTGLIECMNQAGGWMCHITCSHDACAVWGESPCVAVCLGVLKAYGVETKPWESKGAQ